MSCFIVSDDAINSLLTAMDAHYKQCCRESGLKYHLKYEYKEDELNKFGNELMKWNIESVNRRYNEYTPFNSTKYKWDVDYSRESLLKGIKQGSCIRYQCDESLNPKLYAILDNVIFVLAKAIMRMDGFKDFSMKTRDEVEAYVKGTKDYMSLGVWG